MMEITVIFSEINDLHLSQQFSFFVKLMICILANNPQSNQCKFVLN